MHSQLYFLWFLIVAVTAYSDNCHGSGRCNKNMSNTCRGAWARFTEFPAIMDTQDQRQLRGHLSLCGKYPSLTGGARLKGLFEKIYGGQGCKECGSHAFNGGNCEVTLNFCSNCLGSGNPN